MASLAPFLLLLLRLLSLGAPAEEEPCAYETNRIKDLLQASCAGRGLARVPSGLAAETGILLLGANRLARVSTASLAHLRALADLDLSGNGLEELEAAAALPGLRELDLSRNALARLPALRAFPGLVRLALGHNLLAALPAGGGFRGLARLADLELQGNRLGGLPEGAFAGLAGLKDLDLSDNRLAALPAELLAGLGALETLRLERNRLRAVPEGFFPEGHTFAYVYLAGNPWRCDCALRYLRDWLVENAFSVYTRRQGPQEETTENQPESVTCAHPPEETGRPVMEFSRDCRQESGRGARGDEEPPETQPGPTTPPGGPASAPSTTRPLFTQPESSPPTRQGSPATALPTANGVQAASTSSPPGTPPASTSATPRPPSPTPATPPGSLATTLPTSKGVQEASASSPPGTPPASTTATLGPGAPPSTPPQTTPASPAPTGSAASLLEPPPYCQCPLPPGMALGLHGQQPPPMSWAGWLAARCCPLRLALHVACLGMASLPTLALLCCCRRLTVGMGTRPPPATRRAVGPHQLQHVAWEGQQVPGEEGLPLPRPGLYRVCRRLEVGPLRYVTWLLVSLPGPSGRWPWEQQGSPPPSRLEGGKQE